MMLNHLEEVVEADGICYRLSGDEHGGGKEIAYPEPGFLEEFFLDCGLPTWRFSKNGLRIEKRVMIAASAEHDLCRLSAPRRTAGSETEVAALTPLSSAR